MGKLNPFQVRLTQPEVWCYDTASGKHVDFYIALKPSPDPNPVCIRISVKKLKEIVKRVSRL